MQFSVNPLLALSIAGFAIILSTASPVITHKPIPVSFPTTSSFLPPAPLPTLETSVNATSTSLIVTTTTIPGIPHHPSTLKAQVPTTRPNGGVAGCEYPHLSPSLKNSLSFSIYIFFGQNESVINFDESVIKHATDSAILFFLLGHSGFPPGVSDQRERRDTDCFQAW